VGYQTGRYTTLFPGSRFAQTAACAGFIGLERAA